MIVTDAVKNLIDGGLDIRKVGRALKEDYVELILDTNQITAMWVARDLIIIRFCWGVMDNQAWDVIIDRSNFEKGNDDDFVKFMKKELYGKQIRYNLEEVRRSNGEFRLGNRSTNFWENYLNPWINQNTVKVFNVHWGPFKKREQNKNLIDKSRQG